MVAEPPFRVGEQRHRRRGERGQADPDPACGWVVAGEECAQRLDADVSGEQEEADCDQLLRAPLGAAGATPLAGEEPEHHTTGERLDQAVRSEADQCDRAGSKPGSDRDRELDHVPADTAPGEQPRPPLEPCPLGRRGTGRKGGNGERPRLAELQQRRRRLRHARASCGAPPAPAGRTPAGSVPLR